MTWAPSMLKNSAFREVVQFSPGSGERAPVFYSGVNSVIFKMAKKKGGGGEKSVQIFQHNESTGNKPVLMWSLNNCAEDKGFAMSVAHTASCVNSEPWQVSRGLLRNLSRAEPSALRAIPKAPHRVLSCRHPFLGLSISSYIPRVQVSAPPGDACEKRP